MKVTPVNTASLRTGKFKKHIFGYDDEISKNARSNIREHINNSQSSSAVPAVCLSEEEEKKVFNELMNIQKKSEMKKAREISKNLFWAGRVNLYQYKGPCLAGCPEQLALLKNSGIETVISFISDDNYEKQVKEAGLNYIEFPDLTPVSRSNRFPAISKDKFVNSKLPIYEDKENGIKKLSKEYEENAKQYIEKSIIPFIKTMQKEEKLYMGCQFGSYRTNQADIINSWFNPKAADKFSPFKSPQEALIVSNIYEHLTSDNKKQLGFTKKFEEEFQRNYNEYFYLS